MKTDNWLNFFKENSSIKIFHINHLKALTDVNKKTININLSRLTRRKIILRICRNYYANPFNQPTLYEISGQIHRPNYISLETALNMHGILSQIPQVLTCVSTDASYKVKTTFGIIEYRQIPKYYYFGFVEKKNYFLAEPEKAFLDYIYLHKRHLSREFLELKEWDLSHLKTTKLNKYAKKMNITLPRKFIRSLRKPGHN